MSDTADRQIAQERQQLKAVAKGGGIALVGSISAMGLGVALQWVLARSLGPSGVGVLSLGLSLTQMASVLVVFGMQRGVVKFVAHYASLRDPMRLTGTIHSALRVVALLALIVTPILLLSSNWLAGSVFGKPDLAPVLWWLALSVPFAALTEVLVAVAQALKRIEYKALIQQLALPLLRVLGVLIFAYAIGAGAVRAAQALLSATVLAACIAAMFVWRLSAACKPTQGKPVRTTREILGFSWPLLLTTLVDRANYESETLVLGALAASAQVGLYYTGLKATAVITVFLAAINVIFAPIIAELYAKGNRRQMASMYQTVTRWAVTLSLPVCLAMLVLGREIIGLFGESFAAGAPILQLLAASQLIFVATGPSGWLLTMTGHPRYNLLNTSLTLALTVALDFLLVPRYAAMGAAVGGAVTIALINSLRLIEVRLLLRMQPYNRRYLKAVTAGIVALVAAIGVRLWLAHLASLWRIGATGGTLVGVYVLALCLLRMEGEDLAILQAIIRHLRSPRLAFRRDADQSTVE